MCPAILINKFTDHYLGRVLHYATISSLHMIVQQIPWSGMKLYYDKVQNYMAVWQDGDSGRLNMGSGG